MWRLLLCHREAPGFSIASLLSFGSEAEVCISSHRPILEDVPTFLLIEAAAFVLGLLFGSFLNVCIARLPEHRSIVKPRSECPHCSRMIRWYDNVPLLSFVLLRGRCRNCGERISWQYPVVELLIGAVFAAAARGIFVGALAYAQPGEGLNLIFLAIGFAILGFLLIGLAFMDWQSQALPDAFTLSGIGIGFFLTCVQAIFLPAGVGDVHLNSTTSLRMSSPGSMQSQGNVFLTGPEALVFGRLAAICGAALLLWLVGATYKALRRRQGVGLGDVKLLALIAAFLGFWPAILSLFLGLIFALPYAIFLLAKGRATSRTALPFGTFLCVGGLVAAVIGGPLIVWYRSLL
jgi:leader peptidase (prepilin peptidase)/N-methyltransferase